MKNKHIALVTFLLLPFMLLSCKQASYKNQNILKSITSKVDAIEIFVYGSADTLKTLITEKKKINIICDLIDGKVDDELKICNPSGYILFYSKNTLIFESSFSIGKNCEQLTYFLSPQHYVTKLTYRAGMLLGEVN